MDAVLLARLQFAVTTVYHFFFVPLTLGLSILVAIMETIYVRTGNEIYKKMTKFWGKLFLINFAMGVVTGIVQEFQFGMNWSEYSRFMGDIFGAPLAIEALLAFYHRVGLHRCVDLRLGQALAQRLHCRMAWLVAIGSNLSALWILIANSFMQQPVGYVLTQRPRRDGRISSPCSATATSGSSGRTSSAADCDGRLLRCWIQRLAPAAQASDDLEVFRRSFSMAVVFGLDRYRCW